MSISVEVVVSAITSMQGKPQPTAELPDQDLHPELVSAFPSYGGFDRSVSEAALSVARATLGQAWLGVSGVIYSSETDPDRAQTLRSLSRLCDLELAECVQGFDCGNLGPALSAAESMLRSSSLGAVLVVLADASLEKSRFMRNQMSVFSDAAVAFLVSRIPSPTTPGLQVSMVAGHASLRSARQLTILELVELGRGNFAEVLGTHLTPEWLVLPNYRTGSNLFLSAALSVVPDRLLRPQYGGLAHSFSADPMLAIQELATADSLRQLPGAICSFGTATWTTLLLREVRNA